MQREAPEAFDVTCESSRVQALYGCGVLGSRSVERAEPGSRLGI